jgi:hypothetical protein
MLSEIISSAGIILNIIGLIFLFIYGFPQPDFSEGVGLSLEDFTPVGNGKLVKDIKAEAIKKRKKYKVISILCLIAILIGTLMELIGLWI